MPNREERRKEIRTQLSRLRTENAHHEFEKLCLHLTSIRIAANVRPATGPVAAGGDQGRDFETFPSHLRRDPSSALPFLRLVTDDSIAFACTMQQARLGEKIQADVAKIVKGAPVDAIHYFSEAPVPKAQQHELEAWAKSAHGLTLTIHDGDGIATMLLGDDAADLVQHFLGIPPELDATPLLEHWTAVALADAELILEEESDGRSAVYLSDLYIEREVEANVVRLVSETPDPHLLVVKSQAGHGKTSLLWRLHDRLARLPAAVVWLVKATSLSGPDPRDVERIEATVARLVRTGRRPVLLVDTADLLLHAEAERDAFRLLVRMLLDAGCFVIVTSRPQEAALLKIDDRILPPVTLPTYSPAELAAAVETHVKTFYARAEVRPSEEHLRRLRESIASGRKLSDVWVVPLTLRMLFYLYTPEEIAGEVDKYDLYDDYWRMRVERDQRAGTHVTAGSRDCSDAAMLAALVMLAAGRPEIPRKALTSVYGRHGIPREDVELLLTRGVLRSAGSETIAFFHQSFFEHAAGRALVHRYGKAGLDLIRQRVLERKDDFFLNAVYEQTLLVADDDRPLLRALVDERVAELLAREQSLKRSGLYVHAHRRRAPSTPLDVTALAAVPPLAIDFLSFASNMREERMDELFVVLQTLWAAGESRIRHNMVVLLARLALRTPRRVIEFLDANAVVSTLLAAPRDATAKRELLAVLEVLARSDPEWTLAALDTCYRSTRGSGSSDLRDRIMELLLRQAPFLGAETLASRFAALTSKRRRSEKDLNMLWGRLWHVEWSAARTPVAEIIAGIGTTADKDTFARLFGLALTLAEREADECRQAWEHFVTLPHGLTVYWSQILWSNLLVAPRPTARELIAAELRRNPSGAMRDALLYTIRHAEVAQEWLHKAFGGPPYDSADGWLTDAGIVNVLAKAYRAGLPAAADAVRRLAAGEHPAYAAMVLRALAEYPAAGEEEATAFLDLLFRQDDAQPLTFALRHGSSFLRAVLESRRAEVETLLLRAMRSRVHDERRRAAEAWVALLDEGCIAPPRFEQLRAALQAESTPSTRGTMALLLGKSVGAADYDGLAVIDILFALADDGDAFVRHQAIVALRIALILTRAGAGHLARFVGTILEDPDDQQQIAQIGYLIAAASQSNIAAAAASLRTLLLARSVQSLTGRQSNRLMNYLRAPVFQFFFAATEELQREILSLVPEITDRHLGRLVVEAASAAAFHALLPDLNELLANPAVDADVKRQIGAQKHRRERTEGSEVWPELDALLGG